MSDDKHNRDTFEDSLQAAATAVTVKALPGEDSLNQKRIAELRRLYRKGEYKVDALATATRIIDDHLGSKSLKSAPND